MLYFQQQIELVIANIEFQPKLTDGSDTFYNQKICPEYLLYSKNESHKHPEINIYYGPYECNRIIKYRPEKLQGFIKFLESQSYNVKLIPFGYLNTVEIVSMGYLIYKFDIRYLKFNMPYKDDPVCIKAADVIKEAVDRLYGENNISTARKTKNRENASDRVRRVTTMSVSSKISLSEYDMFVDNTIMYL